MYIELFGSRRGLSTCCKHRRGGSNRTFYTFSVALSRVLERSHTFSYTLPKPIVPMAFLGIHTIIDLYNSWHCTHKVSEFIDTLQFLSYFAEIIGLVSRRLVNHFGRFVLIMRPYLSGFCETESWDELHKASVTERFVALRNATVRYQKALRSAL